MNNAGLPKVVDNPMDPVRTHAAVQEILSMPKYGKGIGFARMRMLLSSLFASEWGRRFTTIRVTGTNGKGSVTAMTHSILHALGVRVGRFTSPHLIKFNERILIGDREISDDEIDRAYVWVQDEILRSRTALRHDDFGSFELVTAVCLRSFFEANLSLGVMEAGIGGRYDATRMLPGNLASLTSVALEHTELLGKTEELIAYDKLDICPDGGIVVSVCRDTDLWRRIHAYCSMRRITLINALDYCGAEYLNVELRDKKYGMNVRIRWENQCFDAFVPLVGAHQLENIAVAVSLVRLWMKSSMPEVSSVELVSGIVMGLQNVSWPARLECISFAPKVFIDVGHSPDALLRLAETVRTLLGTKPILLVTGVSADKAVKEILENLVPVGQSIICTRAHHKGERVEQIADLVRQIAPAKEVFEAKTIQHAVKLARQLATANDMTVLVAGGLFLAIEFKVAWAGGDPTELTFF